jgi:hypothetical protein
MGPMLLLAAFAALFIILNNDVEPHAPDKVPEPEPEPVQPFVCCDLVRSQSGWCQFPCYRGSCLSHIHFPSQLV